MPAPFYNAIKGTTAGTPGTGAFTPNAASAGFRAWSLVPTGWIGLVRYEDGASWELTYSYWNGTTLSRASTQLYDSSSGSAISLTSAATAALVADANEIGFDFATLPARGAIGGPSITSPTAFGCTAPTVTGTGAGLAVASTNFLTRQHRAQATSATTANAQAGWSNSIAFAIASSTAGVGGWLFTCRFGATTGLPTGPRLFVGMTSATFVGQTIEPSAFTAHFAAVGLDSTDTNLQIITNSNAGAATKIDTGMPLALNGWYEISLWSEPGSLTINYLLIRIDTGAILYGSTATDIPATNIALVPNCIGGLNGTNTGTAIVLCMGHYLVRTGQ